MAAPDPSQRKLPFRVVFASSQDADYPASELNAHAPSTKGWQSARFGEFPQEIGLQFTEGSVVISQIQLLSHQCKIARRVELFTGEGADYFHASFTRLGYLSLDSNERSQFKARELKSVYVKARGAFLKLLLHQCYVNQHNLFNQVGLIAVNVLGQPGPALGADAVDVARAPSHGIPGVPMAGNVRPAGVHDLAVDMGLDPQTAALLRDVAARKDAAVASEDFETAKRLKGIQDAIKSVGGQLAALEAKKAQAVAEEDYDSALHIKLEIQRIRNGLSEKLADAGLHGFAAPRGAAPPPSFPGYPSGPAFPPSGGVIDERPIRPAPGGAPTATSPSAGGYGTSPSAAPAPARSYEEPPAPASPAGFGGRPASRAIRPAPSSSLDEAIAAEERRLAELGPEATGSASKAPAPGRKILTKAERAAALAEESAASDPVAADPFKPADFGANGRPDPSQLAGVDGAAELPAPDQLTASAEKDAGPLIELFGSYVARCFFSKDWHLREAAVAKMAIEVTAMLSGRGGARPSDSQLFQACMSVVNIASKDKIAAVFEKAVAKLLPVVLQGASGGLRKGDMTTAVEPVMPVLVEKLGDNTARIRDSAVATVLLLASQPGIGASFVAGFVLQKMSKKQASSWKPLQTRVAVLAELVEKSNLLAPSSGISAETLVKYCVDNGTFAHANADIRKATEDLATAMFKVVGRPLLGLLQPHLRPKQMEEYQAAFSAAGGAPVGGPVAPGPSAPPAAAPARSAPGGKAPAGGRPPQAAPAPAAAATDGADGEDGVCQFCGGCGPGASEQELDLHYWQSCPMLMACPRCQQIIEIVTLHEHLLDECEFKAEFEPCPTCGDAIAATELDVHVRARVCEAAPDPAAAQRCPLCGVVVRAGKDAWVAHIMRDGCERNPRSAKPKAGAAPARRAK